MTSVIDELRLRGFISQVTETGLPEIAGTDQLTVYVGFDPTAASLHLGHVIPLLALSHFQRYGHRVIALVGGGTGMIGDPSGKATERVLLSEDIIAFNTEALKSQISRFLTFEGDNPAVLVDNASWINETRLIPFLRDIGKHFSVNMMLAKDSVRARLEERSQGISFTEFSYMLLQSFDYLQLFDQFGCNLQIGGSDQWGNIAAGIDLIRRVRAANCHGLTCPLLTKSDGTKFGKTEGGAIWLDPKLTTPYDMYQYWLNVDDNDVMRFLRIFTYMPLDEINQLETEVQNHPERRGAQRELAMRFTALVHGQEIADECVEASAVLFGGSVHSLKRKTLHFVRTLIPTSTILRDELQRGVSVEESLVKLELAKSKGEAKRLISNGGVYVNDQQISEGKTIKDSDLLHDEGVFVRVGKKKYGLLMVE